MKRISPTLLPFLFIITSIFHASGQCDNFVDVRLAANRVDARILTGGDFFWNRNDGKFAVPFVPGPPMAETSSIFAGALWLGGIDMGGNLKLAAQTYGNANGRMDYLPGPIDDNTSSTLPSGCEQFRNIWKINRGDILQVKEDFEENGTIDLPLPDDVLSWPARGNPHFESIMGFPLPDQELAPFFDRNGNGLFEPMEGEYPLLDAQWPTAIPDEMTWTVFNDIQAPHTESTGLPIGAEVHFMAYSFNCTDDEVLNHTVFTRHKVFNKSGEDLSDFRIGIWLDVDLGCYIDDYFGCDTLLNSLYFYNSDNDDNDPTCTGIGTYGVDPPVQAITFLNQPLDHLTYYNNGGFGVPIFATTDPADAVDFYNYMRSIWLDITPFTFGGNAYDLTSNDLTNHVFTDPPSDPNGWSLVNAQLPLQDRRTVMSTGPFDLPAGSHRVLDAAFSYHRSPGADHLGNVDVALSEIPSVIDFYENGLMENCSQFLFCEDNCMRPGDANNDGIADHEDVLAMGYFIGQNAAGTPRDRATFTWASQEAGDWGGGPADLPDPKHSDCNGDGSVDVADFYIIEENYDRRIPGYVEELVEAPMVPGGLSIDIDDDEVSAGGSIFQRRISCDVLLGSPTQPVDELYGVSFSIRYDTSIWEPSISLILFIDESVLGGQDEVLVSSKVFPEEGRLEASIVRYDGQAINNVEGQLASFALALREDAATGNQNGQQTLSFKIYNAVGIDSQGNLFQLGGLSDKVIGTDMTFDENLTALDDLESEGINFAVQPNPNDGSFHLFFETAGKASQISIMNFNGQHIYTEKIPANARQFSLDLEDQLSPGIYFIRWTLPGGDFDTKKIIVH